jgi:transcription initiation factor TFIIB
MILDDIDGIDDESLWNMLDKISDAKNSDNSNNSNNSNNNNTNNSNNIIKNKNICSICQLDSIIHEQSKGAMVCTNCGQVSSNMFDQNPEWSQYEDGKGEGSMRCGAATNYFLPKSSLGTTISSKGFSVLKMLQTWNQMPYKERSLSETLQFIDQTCKKTNIPKSVIDNAKILYKQINDQKYDSGSNKDKNIIIRGNNRRGIQAACVYYGAKLQGYPRSIKEISDMFNIKLRNVTKGCRKFIELMKQNKLINNMSSTSPKDYIERFGYKLKLKKPQIETIIKIAMNISKLYLASNHQPTSIAAGSILIYGYIYEIDIQKKLISEIFDISIVTIDKIYKKILPFKKVIVSDELTDFVKNKLMKANYIMKDESQNNIDVKNHLIDMSDEIELNLDTISETEIDEFEDQEFLELAKVQELPKTKNKKSNKVIQNII